MKTPISAKKVVPVTEVPLSKALEAVALHDEGRVVLAHLVKRCGFLDTSLSRKSDGSIDPVSTEAKEAQRLIWIELRRHLPLGLRHAIEELAETPVAVKSEEERKK